jgi:hypothetical protein
MLSLIVPFSGNKSGGWFVDSVSPGCAACNGDTAGIRIQKGAAMSTETQNKNIPFPKIVWNLITTASVIAVLISRLPK